MKSLFSIFYCIVLVFACVGFILYLEPFIAYLAYFLIELTPDQVVNLGLAHSFKGTVYLYVGTLIIFNIVLGSICFGFNSTQELVAKIKAQKLLGKVSPLYLFFLTLRFYLTAFASALLVYASLYTTLQILFNKPEGFTLNINNCIFIFLFLLHLIVSYYNKTAKGQIFFQVSALVVVNWIFVLLSLKGYAFESLTISEFNMGASIAIASVCQILGPNNRFLRNANKLAFRFIGKEQNSIRKRLVSFQRLQPYAVFSEKYYFLSLYSFMAFTKVVCWTLDYYLSCGKKVIIEDQYFVVSFPTFVCIILIGVLLTFQLLRSAARYNYTPIKQRYYVPLDFCILYGGLIKPLIDLSYETWLVVYYKSIKGFGLMLLNPAAICINKELPHYVMYIASPSEGFWNFMTVGFPSVVRDFANFASKTVSEHQLEKEIASDNSRLDSYMPYVQRLKKVAKDPKDLALLDKYSELTFQNANPRHTLTESKDSVAARDAALSAFINTSQSCEGVCPVSPRSGLVRPAQFAECLKNAAERATIAIEQL